MKNRIIVLVALISLSACQNKKEQATQQEAISTITTQEDEKALDFKTHNIKTVGILVYDGVNSLDVFGPRYVLGQIMGVDMKLIAHKPGNVKTVMGIEFVPDAILSEVDSLDILVIPGGFRGTIEAAYDEEIQQWIRDIDKTTTYTSSVCTGGWILARTRLLKEKRATTNWYDAENKLAKYGAIFTDERYTNDGKYWTAAGVTAGMDMSLALLAEIAGKDYAQGVMLDMEYDPAPPFGGGSPEKTRKPVFEYMNTMYEAGVEPIFEELENGNESASEVETVQDVVCKMSIQPSNDYKQKVDGVIYNFCSAMCEKLFNDNPNEYVNN